MRKALGVTTWLVASLSSCALLIDLQSRELASDDGGSSDGAGDVSSEGGPDAGDDAPSCDADINVDPSNCGRCGHYCAGSGCNSGNCELQTLATGLINPTGIAVTGGEIYWIESGDPFADGGVPLGEIWKMSVDGGAATKISTSLTGPIDSIAAGGEQVYWADEAPTGSTRVFSPAGIVCPLPGLARATHLAATSKRVYVVAFSGGNSAACLFDGGVLDNPFNAQGLNSVGAVAATENAVLFGTSSHAASAVTLCPPDFLDVSACDSAFYEIGGDVGPAVAQLSASLAFWSEDTAANSLFIRSIALDAGARPTGQTSYGAYHPVSLASDDTDAFLAATNDDRTSGAVYAFSCNAARCNAPQILVNDVPTAVAIDDVGVYVAVSRPLADGGTTGQIVKIAKP